MLLAQTGADWLTAGGGIAAAVASIVLAFLAYGQMKAARTQAATQREAANKQAAGVREQLQLQREAARDQEEATQRQLSATLEIAQATRETVAFQQRPLVYAHQWGPPARGPTDKLNYGEIEFRYWLSNEGLGPALEVQHGIELARQLFPFGSGGGFRFRTIRAGEILPPLGHDPRQPVPAEHVSVIVRPPSGGEVPQPVYWCRFKSLTGEEFETRNFTDPSRPAEFRSLEEVEPQGTPPRG